MDQRVEAFIYDEFDAFRMGLKQFGEENDMDIKVGDTVKAINSGCGYQEGNLYTVAGFTNPLSGRFINVIDIQTGERGNGCYISSFVKIDQPKHEGKILIMVDEKDNNKIIARNLVTGKKAEAKCNPKDEWDFNKGAKLALERLTEPEKPKGWTGKVVCVKSNSPVFTVGKVYTVTNGTINYNISSRWITSTVFTDIETLNHYFDSGLISNVRFIEFKGEVTAP